MKTGPKLAAYGLVLAAVFGGGAALGAAAGPIEIGGTSQHEAQHPERTTNQSHGHATETQGHQR